MRNKIFGVIGMLCGGAIIVNWLLGAADTGGGSYQSGYQTGKMIAVALGVAMFIVGMRYVFFKPSKEKSDT